uniref:Uncharacterized protein AlNc14C113G6437 n=1 Tax=Albugo laibachii Nc14 TaxID=890382 RepID=F0WIP4_9STRA|nr:conserved hypothetical protein [Albugo laibachii Nc14]|eukprot:CCA21135.1 conserved hypothetical protein [Albugo laibachii Nc14]
MSSGSIKMIPKARSLASLEQQVSLPTISDVNASKIAQRWVELILNEKFSDDFALVARNGQVLCELMKCIFSALGLAYREYHSEEDWKKSFCLMELSPSLQQQSPMFRNLYEPSSSQSLRSKAMMLESKLGRSLQGKKKNDQLRQEARSIMLQNDVAKRQAFHKITHYTKCCLVLGVAAQNCFEPEDLYELRALEKVFRNILALQSCALALSIRRTLEDKCWRYSLEERPDDKELLKVTDLSRSSELKRLPDAMEVTHDIWECLLTDYEETQSRWAALSIESENSDDIDQAHSNTDVESNIESSRTEGLAELAHEVWIMEERIRSLLLSDDLQGSYVPDQMHGKLWLLASGAAIEMQRRQGYYQQLLTIQPDRTEALRQIDADLLRTVSPTEETWNEEKTAMMQRILIAYSLHNTKLGYCQGLNFIVSRLLQFLPYEEEVFFLLIKMIDIVPEDYYTTMLGLAVDQHVFADFVRLQLPDIVNRLTLLGGSGVELSLACTEWFLTLFASPCSKEITARILFQMSLALLHHSQEKLVRCDSYGNILNELNKLGRSNINPHLLSQVSRSQNCVIRSRIEDFRAHHRIQLASGIAISSLDDDDPQQSDALCTSPHGDKVDLRQKIFGRRKQSILKCVDKHSHYANRNARTFERHLSSECIAHIQHSQSNLYHASYYDSEITLNVIDAYWGTAESYSQWGAQNVRHIVLPDQDYTNDAWSPDYLDDIKMKGNNSCVSDPSGSQSMMADSEFWKDKKVNNVKANEDYNFRGHFADIRASQPHNHNRMQAFHHKAHTAHTPPASWIQKLDYWQKGLREQKERKKAKKARHKAGRSMQGSKSSGMDSATTFGNSRFDGFGKPQYVPNHPINGIRHSDEHLSGRSSQAQLIPRSSSFVSNRDSGRPEASLSSRSASDYQLQALYEDRTAVDLERDCSMEKTITDLKANMYDAKSISIRDLHPSHAETYSPTLTSGASETIDILPLQNITKVESTLIVPQSQHDELRSACQERRPKESTLPPRFGPPSDHLSASADRSAITTERLSYRGKSDNLEILRDRAHVVAYLQRKASDAGSIAGSLSRSSPRERPCGSSSRCSGSSSNSSALGTDQLRLSYAGSYTSRTLPPSFQRGSLSFFDRFSLDVENYSDAS